MVDPRAPFKKIMEAALSEIGDFIIANADDIEKAGLTAKFGTKAAVESGILRGDESAVGRLGALLDEGDLDKVSQRVREIIQEVLQSPYIREFSETMGVLMTEPFVAVLESYADKDEVDAREFSAAFHGATMLLTMPSLIAEALRGSAIGTIIGPFGDAMKSIYWNLGLGFLGWQTLAPLLSAGLQPKMEAYYNKRFTPKRFDIETMVYLYHIGKASAGDVLREGLAQGWSADKTQTLVDIGYHTLARSDMSDLYIAGKMSIDDISDELLRQGYNPRYIPTIINGFIQETKSDERLPSLATARKAHKSGLYTDNEFVALLRSLGYGTQAISLELSLARQALQQEQRELTISQIKQAFSVGEVSEHEVRVYLLKEGYENEQILILLNTWRASRTPTILKLNKGAITSALTRNVITPGEASARLTSLGYQPQDVKIIIDTALASGGASGHSLSISKLLQAYSIEAISLTELTSRLRGRGVSDSDIQIYVSLANFEAAQELTKTDVQNAFLYGTIDSSKAIMQLVSLGFVQADAQYLTQTWIKQRESFSLKLTPGLAILYYRQKLLSSNELRRKLIELGFSQTDADLMVRSADLAYPRELSSNEIKDLFFTQTVTATNAVQLLTKTGLDTIEAQNVVKSWQTVLVGVSPQPTVAQFLSALRDGLLEENEFITKMREKGYDEQSIAFYIRLAGETEIETTKSLTKTDVLGLFDDELLTYTDSLDRLIRLGYSPDDSELLLARKKPSIKDSQAHKLFMAGYINPDNYVEILLGLGYSPDDIDDYLTSIGF